MAGAAAREVEDMSQELTQRQGVGAEDDGGCCIEPRNKDDGVKKDTEYEDESIGKRDLLLKKRFYRFRD
jgi:hypothetical protein